MTDVMFLYGHPITLQILPVRNLCSWSGKEIRPHRPYIYFNLVLTDYHLFRHFLTFWRENYVLLNYKINWKVHLQTFWLQIGWLLHQRYKHGPLRWRRNCLIIILLSWHVCFCCIVLLHMIDKKKKLWELCFTYLFIFSTKNRKIKFNKKFLFEIEIRVLRFWYSKMFWYFLFLILINRPGTNYK